MVRFFTSLSFASLLTFALASGGGCAELSATGGPRPLVKQDLESSASEKFRPLKLNEIAVYPLSADAAVRAEISPDDLNRLSERLSDTLIVNTSFGVFATGKQGEEALSASRAVHGPLHAKATNFGQALGTQGVLYGIVSKYQESDGGRLGAENTAAVRFRLWLVEVASGEVVWEASFDRTDKPLSENIFEIPAKVNSGVRYKQALDLATDGFVGAAKDLEKRRSEASAS